MHFLGVSSSIVCNAGGIHLCHYTYAANGARLPEVAKVAFVNLFTVTSNVCDGAGGGGGCPAGGGGGGGPALFVVVRFAKMLLVKIMFAAGSKYGVSMKTCPITESTWYSFGCTWLKGAMVG